MGRGAYAIAQSIGLLNLTRPRVRRKVREHQPATRVDGSYRTLAENGARELRDAEGLLHGNGVPAVIRRDGSVEYYNHGRRHRTDGPAVIYADGSVEYYVDGALHRTDGPACEYTNGHSEYWVNGLRHRTDGPAVIREDGSEEYWIDGVRVPAHRVRGR
jgi:hypothetical protein